MARKEKWKNPCWACASDLSWSYSMPHTCDRCGSRFDNGHGVVCFIFRKTSLVRPRAKRPRGGWSTGGTAPEKMLYLSCPKCGQISSEQYYYVEADGYVNRPRGRHGGCFVCRCGLHFWARIEREVP